LRWSLASLAYLLRTLCEHGLTPKRRLLSREKRPPATASQRICINLSSHIHQPSYPFSHSRLAACPVRSLLLCGSNASTQPYGSSCAASHKFVHSLSLFIDCLPKFFLLTSSKSQEYTCMQFRRRPISRVRACHVCLLGGSSCDLCRFRVV
jgi:hypothetical protein